MARQRRLAGLVPVLVISLLAAAVLGFTFWKGNEPLLGLDLQGGVSVVLKPKSPATDAQLNDAIAIMRQRIDSLGVAEPEITKQGQTILIQIPGVKDQQRAIELVGTTAEVRFRPVLATFAPEGAITQVTPSTLATTPGTDSTGTTAPGAAPAADAGSTTVPPPASITPTSSAPSSPDGTQQLGLGLSPGENAAGAQAPTTPSTVSDAPPASAATPAPSSAGDSSNTTESIPAEQLQQLQQQLQAQQGGSSGAAANCPPTTTPPDQDKPDQTVLLPYFIKGQEVSRLCLGPAALTGTSLTGAVARLDSNGRWVVLPTFKGGSDGIDKFNALAAQCYAGQPTCPPQQGQQHGQAAITLDGRVVSAPEIQTPSFQADQVQISGGFTEREAKDLATVLKYGALPIELERQASEQVSATLGRDALHAGLVAGLVGFVLVGLYMLVWYRILGALALLKLVVEGAFLWATIAYLGSNAGLALTLAGVMGIIVSIGVSLDSNVVYYEHIREEMLHGRSVRGAVERSFDSAFSTIVKADLASVLGAAVLWFLAVGPVRGFAFYLGLSTLLDLFTSYFFMRPLVRAATRTKLCERNPRLFGLPRPEDVGNTGRKDRPESRVEAAEPVEVGS